VFLRIDGELVAFPPETGDVIASGFQEHRLPGGGIIFVEDQGGVTVNANYEDTKTEDVLAYLHRLRRNYPIHMLEVEDIRYGSVVALPVFFPKLSINRLLPEDSGCLHTNSAFTISFRQVFPTPTPVHFPLKTYGGASVLDGADRWKMPAAGYVFAVTGFISTLGTGTGQTRIQIRRNRGDVDMLATPGDFMVASSTGLLENQVLGSDVTFMKGDVLYLDIDGVPSGTDSADIRVDVWTYLFRP
jgi:hypothetical protein